MASLRKRNQDSRVLADAKGKVSESATKTIQDCDVRAAILDLNRNGRRCYEEHS